MLTGTLAGCPIVVELAWLLRLSPNPPPVQVGPVFAPLIAIAPFVAVALLGFRREPTPPWLRVTALQTAVAAGAGMTVTIALAALAGAR